MNYCLKKVPVAKLGNVKKIHIDTNDGEFGKDKDGNITRSKLHGDINIDKGLVKHTGTIVIGLNPSIANNEKSDHTFTKIGRYLAQYGVADFYMLNLFNIVSKDPKDIDRKGVKSTDWEKYSSYFEKADLIVIAWGTTIRSERIETAKKDVINFLRENNFKDKVYCVADKQGKKPLHPRRYSYTDELVRFFDD